MTLRDEIRRYGLTALGAFGEAVIDLAGSALQKADVKKPTGDDSPSTSLGGSREDSVTSNPIPKERAEDDPKSLLWDPFAIVEQLGYKDKPTNMTYGTLRAILYKMPIVGAIVQTRINQVAGFCAPQPSKYDIGFKIRTRDHHKEPTKAEKDWIQRAEVMMLRTGVTENPRGRADLENFVKKLVWDSLVYDQLCFEVVPNRKGVPAEWYAVDGSTIRLADTASSSVNEDHDKAVRYVQIYDGMIIAEYTQEEMCFAIRNPRSDIRLQGYGVSELEMLIPTITSLLYSFEFNQKFFTQGSAAKGIINFKGAVSEKQLQNFRRQWYSQIASVQNAWRTPIVNSEELQYVNLQQSARDMEFTAWMDFQIKVACAMFAIDPVEVNFKYGNVGQKSGLHESNNKEKITESKERGLRPLLRHVATAINKYIIWPINESFEFAFVGLDAQTKSELIDMNQKRVKTFMTIDELRAEEDLEPLPDGKGELILDPTYLQFAQMKEGGGGGGGGQMGEGGPEQGSEEGQPDEQGAGDEERANYERMLQQYEDEGDEEEDESSAGQDKATKSLLKSWVVNL